MYLKFDAAKEYKNRSSDENRKDENSSDKHPSAFVVVPLDLEYGDRVDEGKYQEDGRIQVQQQKGGLKQNIMKIKKFIYFILGCKQAIVDRNIF